MTVATLLLLTGLAAQAGAPPPSSDALGQAYFLFLEGRRLEADGQLDAAVAALRKAIEIAPRAPDIRTELSAVHAREGRVGEAIAEAQAALDLDRGHRDAHRILGLIYGSLAERPGADAAARVTQGIRHLEQALAGGVRDAGAELTLGQLYVRDRQYAKGIVTLRAFLIERPGYPEAMLLLAEAYERDGDPAEAIAVLEQLIDIEPGHTRARVSLAELFERGGRWKHAAELWGDLVRRSPRGALLQTRYATALVNAGDVEGGRKVLLEITARSSRDVSAWYLLSQVERKLGNSVGAEQAARRIAEIDDADARGPLATAEAKAARGDFRGAVDTLAPRVNEPRDGDIETGSYSRMAADLAGALQELGERGRAVRVLEEARLRAPQDTSLLFELGAAYERDNRIDEAENVLRDVIGKDPGNAAALNYLGYMLADRGRKLDEAVAFARRAVAIDGDNAAYLDSLGWALFRLGRFDDARAPLERAAEGLPQSSVVQDHLGDLYVQLKRHREALAAFDRALAGDRRGIDAAEVTRKRDRAKELAGR